MRVIEDKGGAIAVMLVSLFFIGTFPAIMTLLERRGRLPQHTYLDYSVTNLLAAVLIAVTLGQAGEARPGMPNFFTQLTQASFFFPLPSSFFSYTLLLKLMQGSLWYHYIYMPMFY